MTASLLLTVGLLLAYCYIAEFSTAAYSNDPLEHATYFVHWPSGPFGWLFWTMLVLNLVPPQLLWFRRYRRNLNVLVGVAVGQPSSMPFTQLLSIPSQSSTAPGWTSGF